MALAQIAGKALGILRTSICRPGPWRSCSLGVIAAAQDDSPAAKVRPDAIEPTTGRGAGLTLAERVGVIEIDLPDGVRV